jgi:tripartite-type tricarboxylate transporter receptor subunit TctC
MLSFRRLLSLCWFVLIAASSGVTRADEIENFYKGKSIRVIIPTGPGGTYAMYGELIDQFLSRHIPGNPTLVMQFIPSGIQAMNVLSNVAIPDGLTIAMVAQTAAITQVLSPENVKYDLRKIAALGMVAQLNAALTVSTKTNIRTADDLKRVEATLGATDTSSYQYSIPEMMNRYFGSKLKVITGYKDVAESTLAMERGEVDGVFTSWLAVKEQRASGALPPGSERVILQVGHNSEPDLDAPLLQDLGVDDKSRQAFAFMASFSALSRGLIAPPTLPAERLTALRAAVAAMIADPAFAAALQQRNLPFRPLSWQEQQDIMNQAASTPRELVN